MIDARDASGVDRSEELVAVPPPAARGAAVAILGLIVLVFLGLTAALISPANAVSTALKKPAAQFLLPHLNQNWGLFAPNPVNTNNSVLMRAQMRDGDKVTTTDWVDLAALANEGVLHNPFPGLDTRFADGLFKYMQPAILALPSSCRPFVPQDQLAAGGASLGVDIASAQAKSKYSQAQLDAMSRYLALDTAARGLATVYAHQLWRGTVVAVQVRLRMTPVPSYANRSSTVTPDSTFYYVGWRAPAELSADALRAWR